MHTAADVVTIVLTLLCHGCPIQAMVAAFGLDERTGAAWVTHAGRHCQQVHQHVVQQGQVDLPQVQADELWVKRVGRRVWMAMALAVPSRLWLGGGVSPQRDRVLLTTLVQMVRSCAAVLQATGSGTGINTASIERLNATFRSALTPLMRRGRAMAHTEATLSAGMWLVGVCLSLLLAACGAARGGPLGPADRAPPTMAGRHRHGPGRGSRRPAQPWPGRGRQPSASCTYSAGCRSRPSRVPPSSAGTISRCGNASAMARS